MSASTELAYRDPARTGVEPGLEELNSVFPSLAADLARVQVTVLDSARPDRATLPDGLWTTLTRPGRMFRPTLALVGAYLHGDDPREPACEQTVQIAAAVQLLHVASLVHDDIIDEAATRRGAPTVAARHGDPAALLSGDHLLAAAVEMVAPTGAEQIHDLGATLRRMCLGQMMETGSLYDAGRTEEDYRTSIAGKTASLISVSLAAGARSAGAAPARVESLRRCGEHLGTAFQMWDDVLDFDPPAERDPSTRFQDVRTGVYTLPVILALRDGGARLRELLAARPSETAELFAVYDELATAGALDATADAVRTEAGLAAAAAQELADSDTARFAAAALAGLAAHLVPGLVTHSAA